MPKKTTLADTKKEFEQNTIRDLNLFAMGIDVEGYGPDILQEFTDRMIENLDKALKQQRAEVLEEVKQTILKVYKRDFSHITRDYNLVDQFRDMILDQLNTPSGDTKLEIKEESK